MKILWLASWYPSELYPFDGDFIQRHSQASALFTEIEVIHVVKDTDAVVTNDVKETVNINIQLTERIIYYKPLKTSIPFVDRILSHLKYKKIYRAAIKKYIAQNGKPAFVHLHIAMKAGLTALWLKRKWNVPYILTEHWGAYLTNANPNIKDFNFIFRYYCKRIITKAEACTFVSSVLNKHMINVYKIIYSVVIPNVVNTAIFYPVPRKQSNQIRLIHISIMTHQKNTEDILTALSFLKNEFSFEMYLYGPFNPSLELLITELGLQQKVYVKGEVSQELLAREIQQSDALVLYSRYETFGCVLIEANACGVPVIVSELEVFHEIVEEGVNGIFVDGENPAALAEKLKQFIATKESFNQAAIAATAAEKYNYNKVGKQFKALYDKLAVDLS